MTKNDIFFAVRGTPFGGKLVPHKTNPDQMVIKSKHPEVGPMLCHAANVEVLDTTKGGTYFLTFVKKEDIIMNLGEALHQAHSGNLQIGFKDEQSGPVIPVFNNLNDADVLDEEDDDELDLN